MFRCDFCQKIAPAGSRCVRIVSEVKETVHPHRSQAIRQRKDGQNEILPDLGGIGKQIKKERKACPDCAKQHAPQKQLA